MVSVLARGGLLVLACLAFVACEEEQQEVVAQQVRAIKTFTVTEVASGQSRRYTAIVQATDTASLSFQVPGNVIEVAVDRGDDVTEGQVLAALDPEPYELDVQAAEAELGRAQARLQEVRVDFDRQRSLFEREWVSQAALDQATAALQSARSEVSFATSKLNLARRDLENTVMTAPFDGVIADRSVDPFVEVATGETLFEINAEGALEVAFNIPETTIDLISAGMPVFTNIRSVAGCGCDGRITEIGSVAGTANAFPVKAGLLDPPTGVRAGMTAEVVIVMAHETAATAFLVPLAAIAPGPEPEHGYVFVYDAETGTVRRTAVQGQGARDNWVAITGGIGVGDIIAVAGVNFLVDGQEVRLMAP